MLAPAGADLQSVPIKYKEKHGLQTRDAHSPSFETRSNWLSVYNAKKGNINILITH